MKFTVSREALLQGLQQTVRIVEKKNIMQNLHNVLLRTSGTQLHITATDLEIQVISRVALESNDNEQEVLSITVPAIKLLSIVKALPKEATVRFNLVDSKLKVSCGKGRYTLSTLPADEYPKFMSNNMDGVITMPCSDMLSALTNTEFSMADKDIRYYLNGINLSRANNIAKFVGSDGHRLSVQNVDSTGDDMSIIIPAKAVGELIKLIGSIDKDSDKEHLAMQYCRDSIRIEIDDTEFSAKLIDSKFPQFDKAFNQAMMSEIITNTDDLKNAVKRVMILSNEKFKGIELKVSNDAILLVTNNPEHDDANDTVDCEYSGDDVEIAFNAQYVVDALSHIKGDDVVLRLAENMSCILINETIESEQSGNSGYTFIIMPMRL